jgi:hypothetical protein
MQFVLTRTVMTFILGALIFIWYNVSKLGIGKQLLMFLFVFVCSVIVLSLFILWLRWQEMRAQRATEIVLSMSCDPLASSTVVKVSTSAVHSSDKHNLVVRSQIIDCMSEAKLSDHEQSSHCSSSGNSSSDGTDFSSIEINSVSSASLLSQQLSESSSLWYQLSFRSSLSRQNSARSMSSGNLSLSYDSFATNEEESIFLNEEFSSLDSSENGEDPISSGSISTNSIEKDQKNEEEIPKYPAVTQLRPSTSQKPFDIMQTIDEGDNKEDPVNNRSSEQSLVTTSSEVAFVQTIADSMSVVEASMSSTAFSSDMDSLEGELPMPIDSPSILRRRRRSRTHSVDSVSSTDDLLLMHALHTPVRSMKNA